MGAAGAAGPGGPVGSGTAPRASGAAFPFDIASIEDAPLETARMTLRPIAPDDSDDVWEYQRLPEVLRYIPWPARSREDAHVHTLKRAGMRVLAADGDATHFAMVLHGEPSVAMGGPGKRGGRASSGADGAGPEASARRDRVVGDVMLRVGSIDSAQVEIGWVLHPAFQGRGLAHEAAAEVLRFAFEVIGAHRVFAHLDVRNTASAALCRRLGMRLEGTMLEEILEDDGWQDSELYAILRREWMPRG
ncbi:GNAT family N-acetyltransferase [Agromyces endophyticus]|uniref:GNAT family N-acetyltransferase n=1 Tax=Agromyces sp. H17E-10 TaxID=2932244 RepID=UPI001FD31B97|nr:GNAT family N-acetyltransferase [Agromyces sp. H17E-10]UOQ90871.1 GNAT family N-acetyltransferase [Agromyces sp. H17E-10]